MSRVLLLLLVLATGCEDAGTGGASAVPEVRMRVVELDDDDVAVQPAEESTSEFPVLGPTGEAIVPPEQRVEVDEEDADADE